MRVQFLGHSTVKLNVGGLVVVTDPVLTNRVGHLHRVARGIEINLLADIQVILISHLHSDHLHLPSIRALPHRPTVVVPRGSANWLSKRLPNPIEELAPGETYERDGVKFHGVHANHSGFRWGPRLTIGPQSVAMGHIIDDGVAKVYAPGDTDIFDEMAEFSDVDLALMPVWGWGPNIGPGHLDPERAAQATDLIAPRFAIPIHWGTLSVAGLAHLPGPHGHRMRHLLKSPPIEYASAVKGPTKVMVVQPGETVEV
jgi:L-ascorbate metabolism protein UlaG (beta-lactamase superfamily)